MKPLYLDPAFQYVCSSQTNIRNTFARVRAELAAAAPAPEPLPEIEAPACVRYPRRMKLVAS